MKVIVSSPIAAILLAAAAAALLTSCDRGGSPPPAAQPDGPASGFGVFACEACAGVVAFRPGACPRCGGVLRPLKTAIANACLQHAAIVRAEPDLCPVCERPLKPIAVALAWRCPEHDEERRLAPGECRRCRQPLEESFERMPHGDHNPRHGGRFFMAADQWHHLEGALVAPGEFRIWLYDDFTRPLAASLARGRIEAGPAGERRELAPAAGDEFLAALLSPAPALPLEVTAFLRFEEGGEEHRFDFRFDAWSVEESPPLAGAPAGGVSAVAAGIDAAALSVPELLRQIEVRARSLGPLIAERRFQEIYGPALEAKDLALALEARKELFEGRDAARARRLRAAIRSVVRGAWLLERAGDVGDGAGVSAAKEVFDAGVESLRRGLAD